VRRGAFVLVSALAGLASTSVARADDAADARAEYAAGAAALQKGSYRDAAEHFEVAARLRPNATAIFAAAKAWQLAGELVKSADRYSAALESSALAGAEKLEANRKLAALEEKVGTVRFSGDPSMEAQIDDGPAAHAMGARHATPGHHTLLVRGNGQSAKQEITLTAGGSLPFDLKPSLLAVEAPAAPTPAPAPASTPGEPDVTPRSSGSATRTTGIVLSSIGLAAVGASIGLGVAALGAKDTFNKSRTQADYDSAIHLQTATNVGWVTAGVLGGLGATLIVVSIVTKRSPAPTSTAWIEMGPRGGKLVGRF
jgi:hypothetical protein